MLKRLEYQNVITFSYGLPGNRESHLSKQVADRLQLPWHFVPYYHEDWYHWFRTEEYRTYSRMADGLCSVPHEQDWPAVWQLTKQAILPADAIFSPGHSADLLSGSRSGRAPALYDIRTPVDNALREILHLHYDLQDWPERFRANSAFFLKKIRDIVGDLVNYRDAASVLEYWEVQERQAKYIVNSIRVYEYWGYGWWLPFWDREYLEFWKRVPLSLRIHQKLYKRYVEKLYGQVAGVSLNLARESEKRAFRYSLGRVLRRVPFWFLLRKALERTAIWRLAEYQRDPIFGIVPKEVFLSHSSGRSLLAFEALEQLGLLSFDRPNRSE
jgi:asparagine synthase (glutamine-hydrolysing)